MTKEEAIKSFEEDNRTMLENKTAYINELKARGMEFEDRMVSYIDESVERNELAISALKGEWIPVTERLPNHDECIKNNRFFNVSDGYRSYSEWFDYDKQMFGEPTMSGFRVDYAVTAWQPLPEPYKKGE